jgi:hypothetical protein
MTATRMGWPTTKPPQDSQRSLEANPQAVQLWLVAGAKTQRAYAAAAREFERRVLQWFALAPGGST